MMIENRGNVVLAQATSVLVPLRRAPLALGQATELKVGDPVLVASFGGLANVAPARVVAKREFAGSWEYPLDEAIFTATPHPAAVLPMETPGPTATAPEPGLPVPDVGLTRSQLPPDAVDTVADQFSASPPGSEIASVCGVGLAPAAWKVRVLDPVDSAATFKVTWTCAGEPANPADVNVIVPL